MSRKDYTALAEAIRTSLNYQAIDDSKEGVEAVVDVAHNIAAALHADNPQFRSDLFYEACGLDRLGE